MPFYISDLVECDDKFSRLKIWEDKIRKISSMSDDFSLYCTRIFPYISSVAPSSLVGSSIGFMVRIVENSDNVWCVCGTNIVIKIWIFLDGAGNLANFWISRQNKYDIVNIFEKILTMLFVLESFHWFREIGFGVNDFAKSFFSRFRFWVNDFVRFRKVATDFANSYDFANSVSHILY